MVEAVNRAIARHALRPEIDRVFPIEDAPSAYHPPGGAGPFRKGRDRDRPIPAPASPAAPTRTPTIPKEGDQPCRPDGRAKASPVARLSLLFALAGVTGYAASLAGFPLAWMIGPMLLAAGFAISGRTVPLPRYTRPTGQLVVATAVGLYFTPAALTELLAHLPYMVAAAMATVGAGCATAFLMVRLTRVDAATALFSCVPGGPVEMAQLADRARGNPTCVSAAQSLRISMIVLTIPSVLGCR